MAGNVECPLLVFVETNSRQILEYGVLNALSEWGWGLPDMTEGLSTTVEILEAFLQVRNTIVKECEKTSPRKILRRLPSLFNRKCPNMS